MTNPNNIAFAPVNIGTSPSGVEWIAYRAASVEPMRERLAVLQARHQARTVRRVKLTPVQFEIVDDLLGLREDGSELGYNLRRTFVEASGDDLADLASQVFPDDLAMFAECGSMKCSTDAELAFVWRSAYASALLLAARLNGQALTLTDARKAARRERF